MNPTPFPCGWVPHLAFYETVHQINAVATKIRTVLLIIGKLMPSLFIIIPPLISWCALCMCWGFAILMWLILFCEHIPPSEETRFPDSCIYIPSSDIFDVLISSFIPYVYTLILQCACVWLIRYIGWLCGKLGRGVAICCLGNHMQGPIRCHAIVTFKIACDEWDPKTMAPVRGQNRMLLVLKTDFRWTLEINHTTQYNGITDAIDLGLSDHDHD